MLRRMGLQDLAFVVDAHQAHLGVGLFARLGAGFPHPVLPVPLLRTSTPSRPATSAQYGTHMTAPHNTPPQHTSGGGYTRMPKWVEIQVLLIAIFVVAVIVFGVVYSVGDHGPGRHTSGPTTDPRAGSVTVPMPGR